MTKTKEKQLCPFFLRSLSQILVKKKIKLLKYIETFTYKYCIKHGKRIKHIYMNVKIPSNLKNNNKLIFFSFAINLQVS